ncbi:hypothetical protein FIBSPDRAFT_901132 [Athelia psychrophila]|uniref:Uncharacterized protein n=1 Tax=Athelia psychrophila TaxID=1759441 RepID=A0A165XKW0_9AGAM|nr:hypothetical protein FIBSPDRAFT_901132 [Fibularhizoctonia sp. CBS 109695]
MPVLPTLSKFAMPFSSLSSDNLLNIFMIMLRDQNYQPTGYPIAPASDFILTYPANVLWIYGSSIRLNLMKNVTVNIPTSCRCSPTPIDDTHHDIEQLQTIFKDLHMQNLEELCMLCINMDEEDTTFTNSPGPFFQGGTPCLNTITVDRVTCFPSAAPNLTHLNLENEIMSGPMWEYSDFAKMLFGIPSLTILSMTGPLVDLDNGTDFDEMLKMGVTLPNLRSLTLFMGQDEESTYVFDEEGEQNIYLAAIIALFASAPLQCLFIKGPFLVHIPSILECMHSKVFCFPHVTELDFNVDAFNSRYKEIWSQQDAVTFIQAFPSVERVCLHFEAAAIIDALIGAPAAGDLWHQLQAMFIRDPGSALPSVQKLVESRFDAGRSLQELWLGDFGKRPAGASLDQLEGHVED